MQTFFCHYFVGTTGLKTLEGLTVILCEKCLNTDQEKTPYLGTFQTVYIHFGLTVLRTEPSLHLPVQS